MPQTYHDFNPWARAANNIASGMIAVSEAKAKRAMWQQEMAQKQPLIDSQVRENNATAGKAENETEWARTMQSVARTLAPVISEGRITNPDGSVTFTPDALKAQQTLGVYFAQGAGDYGSFIDRSAQGQNYVWNQKAERRNKRQMNDDDAVAAMERKQADITARANAPFNLSPGAARFDAEGNEIVRNPSAASSRGGGETLPPGVEAALKELSTQWAKAIAGDDMETANRIAASVTATREKWAKKGTEKSSLTPEASSGDGVKTPAVGEVRKGYRFKGGDPSKPESWEKVN